jgi:hypothetical protein
VGRHNRLGKRKRGARKGRGVEGLKGLNSVQEGMSVEPLMMSAIIKALYNHFGEQGLTKPHTQNYIYVALVLVRR